MVSQAQGIERAQTSTLQAQLRALTGCGRAIAAIDYNNLTFSPGRRRTINIAAFCARARAEMGADVLIRIFANEMSAAEEAHSTAESLLRAADRIEYCDDLLLARAA